MVQETFLIARCGMYGAFYTARIPGNTKFLFLSKFNSFDYFQ